MTCGGYERPRPVFVPVQQKAIPGGDRSDQLPALKTGGLAPCKIFGEADHHVAVAGFMAGLYRDLSGDEIVHDIPQGKAGAAQGGERSFCLPVLIEAHAQDEAKRLKTIVALVTGMRLRSNDHLEQGRCRQAFAPWIPP